MAPWCSGEHAALSRRRSSVRIRSGSPFAMVAQSVEQRTENPRVGGSIPSYGTIIMRKWLSGRASPCQGEGREFESRLPLHFSRRHSQVVRQRSAKPLSPVQIWVPPPILLRIESPVSQWMRAFSKSRRVWWNGRHKGLKIPRGQLRVGSSPTTRTKNQNSAQRSFFYGLRKYNFFRRPFVAWQFYKIWLIIEKEIPYIVGGDDSALSVLCISGKQGY